MVKVVRSDALERAETREKIRGLVKACFPDLKIKDPHGILIEVRKGRKKAFAICSSYNIEVYNPIYLERAVSLAEQFEEMLGYEIYVIKEF